MSNLPTKKEIQQVYEHVFTFVDSIPQIITEAETNDDSESLSRISEKVEFEVQALETLANRLVGLQAHAAPSLYSPDRLHRLQAIGKNISSSGLLERLRQSNHGMIELAVILGKRLAIWLQSLRGNSRPLPEESDDGQGFAELLKSLPSGFAEQLTRALDFPLAKAQIAQCRNLLEEEKAILLVSWNDQNEKHNGKRRSSEVDLQHTGNSPRAITRRSQDELFLAILRDWHKLETVEFNFEPIEVAHFIELIEKQASKAKGFSRSSLYRRFDHLFGGYKQYSERCRQKTIRQELMARSGEYSLHQLRSELVVHAKAASETYSLGNED